MIEKHSFNHTIYWLILAASALGLACMLAIVLVISRLPWFSQYISHITSFHTILVLHVNLSLFVWLFSFIAMVLNYFYSFRYKLLASLSLIICSFAVLLMLSTPLFQQAKPILSNYLPVLDNFYYLLALILFVTGFLLVILQVLIAPLRNKSQSLLCPYCLKIIAIACLLSILTALIASFRLSDQLSPFVYYELLFWGSGHQMQIVYTLLMLWSWLWLTQQSGIKLPFSPVSIRNWFLLALSPIVISLFAPVFMSPEQSNYKLFFTYMMIYTSWISLPYLAGKIFITLLRQKTSIYKTTILLSMSIFLLGLFIGSQIQHNNLMIPGHYHALTGAINISLMLVVYHLLAAMGKAIPPLSLQRQQLIFYSLGVVILALGLAWSGYLGLARKSIILQISHIQHFFSLSLMGLGGLVSLLGCFLFLGITFSHIGKTHKKEKPL